MIKSPFVPLITPHGIFSTERSWTNAPLLVLLLFSDVFWLSLIEIYVFMIYEIEYYFTDKRKAAAAAKTQS